MRYQRTDIETYALDLDTPIISNYPNSCKHMIDEINLHELDLNKLQFELFYKIIGQGKKNNIKLTNLSKLSSTHFKIFSDFFYSNQFLLWTKIRNLLSNHANDCDADETDDVYLKLTFKELTNYSIPINQMNLSIRSKNALQHQGYKYSDDLQHLTMEKLLSLKNLGQKSALDISIELQRLNIWQIENEPRIDPKNTSDVEIFLENIDYKNDDIEVIGFTTRTYNCLKRAGINKTSELIVMKDFEIKDLRNLGQKSYQEIIDAIQVVRSKLAIDPSRFSFHDKNELKVNEIITSFNSQILHDVVLIEQNYPNELDLTVNKHSSWKTVISASLNDYLFSNVASLRDILKLLKSELHLSYNYDNYVANISDTIDVISYLSNFLGMRKINHGNGNLLEAVHKLDSFYHKLLPDLINFDEVTSFLFGSEALGLAEKLGCINFLDIRELDTSSLVLDVRFVELVKNIDDFCLEYETLPNILGLVIASKTSGKESKVGTLLFDYLEYSKPDSSGRDFNIIFQRLNGLSLHGIALPLGITRERVRQIINKLNPRLSDLIDIVIRSRNLESENEIRNKILELFAEKGAVYISELEILTSLEFNYIYGLIPMWNRKFIIDGKKVNMSSGKWSRDDLIENIKKASTYYFPLTGPDYQYLIDIGEIDGPGIQRIYQKFGTWSELCLEAGVEFRPSIRGSYDRVWNDEELISFIIRFLEDKTELSSFDRYLLWREKQTDRVPDGGTIRNYFGTWTSAKNSALEIIRNRKSKGVKN